MLNRGFTITLLLQILNLCSCTSALWHWIIHFGYNNYICVSVCAKVCELMCLSAHQLIRWCLVSVSLTNVFPVPTPAAPHFLFNGGEQEIVCHLPIICDSSRVWRQSVAAVFAAPSLVVSVGQRDGGVRCGGAMFPFHSFVCFAPAGSDIVWEDRGDRQHAEPGFRQEVHPGLLLWGEAEPALWRVSYSLWSDPLGTRAISPPLLHLPSVPTRIWSPLSSPIPPSLFLSCLSFDLAVSTSPTPLVSSSAPSRGIIHRCMSQ